MIHKILCKLGIHSYNDPHVRIQRRNIRCGPKDVYVDDYTGYTSCKLCGKEKILIQIPCKLK